MFDQILNDLTNHCSDIITDLIQVNPSVIPRRNIQHAFQGKVNICDTEVSIYIAFDKSFPVSKPLFYLKEKNILGFIPHIETNGFICYMHDEGLVLDQDKPSSVVEVCLKKALTTLINSSNKEDNYQDFVNEFEAYWRRLEGCKDVISLVSPQNTVKPITFWQNIKYDEPIFAADTLNDEVSWYARVIYGHDVTQENKKCYGTFIPLRAGSNIIPPDYTDKLEIKILRQQIFSNLSSANKTALRRILKSKKVTNGTNEYFIISIEQPDGNQSLIGFVLTGFSAKKGGKRTNAQYQHPLLEVQCNFKILPLIIKRHHLNHLIARTGGISSTLGKHVGVIGVGSIGSRVTIELARAGVSNLTLIDNQSLDIDNIYRHELGANRLYFIDEESKELKSVPKVWGLQKEIRTKYPLVKVNTDTSDIFDLLTQDTKQFEQYDLLVVCLGNPTLEIFINRTLRKLDNPPPVIFTWVEPLGIGGHALLTLNNGQNGCLECLYSNLENRASFAAGNQNFAKTISGCGTVFTPYGSLDSLQTTILTTRLAVDVLTGREQDNPLLSWKGDGSLCNQQGFVLTNRYKLTEEQLFKLRYDYKLLHCPVCGNVRGH